MRFVSTALVLLLLFCAFDDAYGARRRRRRRVKKPAAARKVEERKPKGEAPAKKPTPTADARALLSQADSLVAAGDTSAALGLWLLILRADGGDSARIVAAAKAGDVYLSRRMPDSALAVVGALDLPDSVLLPAELELVRVRALEGVGKHGAALIAAAAMEVRYSGTSWAKRARALAKSIEAGLAPIFIGRTGEQTQGAKQPPAAPKKQAQ